jgi:RNA polymerase sigma factor (sigma-70 family)
MVADEDLDALVAAARGGDGAALDALLLRVQPLVLRRCARFLPHRMDAEEAAQDALLAVSRGLDRFTGRGSFRGWVTVVASNSARATYRSLRRRAEVSAPVALEAPDPQTTSVIAGTRLDLLESLDALGAAYPDLVDPFVLRDLGELGYDEIAEQLDLPLTTVKDRIHRARTFVRARLAPAGLEGRA